MEAINLLDRHRPVDSGVPDAHDAPLLKSGATTGAAFGLPEVWASRGPFAGTIGLPLLSNPPSILSSVLGLPMLLNARSR